MSSFLEQQPVEIQVKLLLNLDLPSINNLCEASPLIRPICNDERFWREKIAIDYPEFPLTIPVGATFKETYRLLYYPDILFPIQLDRLDIVEFKGGDLDTVSVAEIAVNWSSPDVLRWALSDYSWMEKMELYTDMNKAIENGDIDLVKIFLESGFDVKPRQIFKAATAGEFEIMRSFVELYPPPLPLFLYPIDLITLSRQERRNFTETVRWLDREGLLSPYEDATIAIVLDDVERLGGRRVVPYIAEYGLRFGSPELVRALSDQGYAIHNLDGLDMSRAKKLIDLGATIDLTQLFYSEPNTELILFLIDAGALDPNIAIAIVAMSLSRYGDVETDKLIVELGQRRRQGQISFDVEVISELVGNPVARSYIEQLVEAE